MTELLIVTTNASIAKFFTATKRGKQMQFLKAITHPKSKLKRIDLLADADGKFTAAGAILGKHAFHTDPKEVEKQKFAQQVVQDLIAEDQKMHYQNLLIFAEPHFAGLLHQLIPKNINDKITAMASKDYTKLPTPELEAVVRNTIG